MADSQVDIDVGKDTPVVDEGGSLPAATSDCTTPAKTLDEEGETGVVVNSILVVDEGGSLPAAASDGTTPAETLDEEGETGEVVYTIPVVDGDGSLPAATCDGTTPAETLDEEGETGVVVNNVPIVDEDGSLPAATCDGTTPSETLDEEGETGVVVNSVPIVDEDGSLPAATSDGTTPAETLDGEGEPEVVVNNIAFVDEDGSLPAATSDGTTCAETLDEEGETGVVVNNVPIVDEDGSLPAASSDGTTPAETLDGEGETGVVVNNITFVDDDGPLPAATSDGTTPAGTLDKEGETGVAVNKDACETGTVSEAVKTDIPVPVTNCETKDIERMKDESNDLPVDLDKGNNENNLVEGDKLGTKVRNVDSSSSLAVEGKSRTCKKANENQQETDEDTSVGGKGEKLYEQSEDETSMHGSDKSKGAKRRSVRAVKPMASSAVITKKKVSDSDMLQKVRIKNKFAPVSLDYVKKCLEGQLFSGWFEERRYVESIAAYRSVIEVDEWETQMVAAMKAVILCFPGVQEGKKWINMTAPSASQPCYCLWVKLEGLALGHYWFQVKEVSVEERFGLCVKLSVVRALHPSDGEDRITRKRRHEGSKTEEDQFSSLLSDWMDQVKNYDWNTVWSFIRTTVTPHNLHQAFKFMVVLFVTLVVGFVTFLRQTWRFGICFIKEGGVFIRNITPFLQSVLGFFEKIFGGLFVLIAMVFRDWRRPSGPPPPPVYAIQRPGPPQAIMASSFQPGDYRVRQPIVPPPMGMKDGRPKPAKYVADAWAFRQETSPLNTS